MTILAVVGALLAASVAPPADLRDYLGRPVVEVIVEVGNVPTSDPSILQLIEPRVGEALTMERVRAAIDHLVALGRVEDIRVSAAPAAARPDGVTMWWTLIPVRRIARVQFSGTPVLSPDDLRAVINERLGTLPPESRAPEAVDVLRTFYAIHGYRRAVISPRLDYGAAPERLTLDLTVNPGPRTLIRGVDVRGDAGDALPSLAAALDLDSGDVYDAAVTDQRSDALAERIREQGYYAASIDVSTTFDDEAARVDLRVDIERGPRVRLVLQGDPLPQNRLDTLVPIRRERSIDLDLLEDASRNIETFLRGEGYRDAEARYQREARDGELLLTFTVLRGTRYRLESVDVQGVHAVPRDEVMALLQLAPGEPLQDQRVASVAAAVGELYRIRGFAQIRVTPRLTLLPDVVLEGVSSRPVIVTLDVDEGPQTTVDAATVTGNVWLATPRVTEVLTLTSGRPFYRPLLAADRATLERLYQRDGFRSVRVEAVTTLTDDQRRLTITWRIVEGPRATVDRVLVSGNARTTPEMIRRELRLTAGQPLDDEALLEGQRRLATLGLFRRVRLVEIAHQDSAVRDILVEVEEAPPTTIAYGGGLEVRRRLRSVDGQPDERIDVAPRAFFEATRRNLGGKNRSLSLFTRVSVRPQADAAADEEPARNEYRVVASFREPRLFDAPADLLLTGFVEQANRSSFTFQRRGLRLEYGRRFGGLAVSSRYSLERTQLFDANILPDDELNIDRLFPQVRLSTLTGSLLRDTRDDALDPQRGTLLGSDLSFALRGLGSEVGFVKAFAQAFLYRQLPTGGVTAVLGARVGVARGFSRTVGEGTRITDVPASERFFAGGDSTVRGFVLDRLGTSATLNQRGFPTGGNGLVLLNAELRSGYWKGIGGVGFVDAGNVFRRASNIRPQDIRPTLGGGLRYRSPIGPLRIDVGWNLDRELLPSGARERGAVFHLSLGQAF